MLPSTIESTAARAPRAVWKAGEIDIGSLTHELAQAEIADLDAALHVLKSSGLPYMEAEPGRLRLPHLEAVLGKLYAQVKSGAGFIMFRGIPVQRYTKDEVRAVAWMLASRFGEPVSQNAKGARVADVMDVIKGASSPRGYHSNAELRLHTDPASDMIGLCCIEAAKEGGDSMLANALAVHDAMQERHPDLLQLLYDGFEYSRFGEGLADDPETTGYKVPVLSAVDGAVSCRFGANRIEGAAKALGQPLTPAQERAIATFREIASDPEFSLAFRMRPGDFLIANNLTLLHARTNFVDNDDPQRPRHLLRFWLAGEDFRPIRPELNFFNKGRCGILPKETP